MADLTRFSDEELKRIAGIGATSTIQDKNLSSFSDEELQQIAGGGIATQERGGLLQQAGRKVFGEVSTPEQVEERIAGRRDILPSGVSTVGRELLSPEKGSGKRLLGGALETAGGLFKRAEAAVATPALRLQREGETLVAEPETSEQFREKLEKVGFLEIVKEDIGGAIETGKILLSDVWKGVTGQSQAEIGDVFRSAGIPENVSSTLGLLATMGLTNLATQGRVVGLAKKAEGVASPIVINTTKKVGKEIARRRSRIFGDKWITEQVKGGRVATEQLDDLLGGAFDEVITPVAKTAVDPNLVDDALLRTFITDADKVALKEITDIMKSNFGSSRVDNFEKLRLLKQIIRKRTPNQYFLGGGSTGKGGIANVKIKQPTLIKQIGNIEINSLKQAGEVETANRLLALNKFAHDKVYPTLGKLRTVFGKSGTPIATEQFSSTISLTGGIRNLLTGGGGLSKAAQRQVIKETPKIVKQFRGFFTSTDYGDDLLTLSRNSKQLLKDMKKFRGRQVLKSGAVGGGLLFGGSRLLPRGE